MNYSSSPPVLYLGDDNDDDEEQNNHIEQNIYFNRTMSSSSNDMSNSRQKRKLTNINVRVNPSVVNWSKRQRNDHYQQSTSHHFIENDPDTDPEPILIDPDEYIIEQPDSHSFRSFDWTLEPTLPPLIPSKIPTNSMPKLSRISTIPTSSNVKHPIAIPQQKQKPTIPAPRPSLALLSKPISSVPRQPSQRGRPAKNSRISSSPPPPPPVRQRSEPQISRQSSTTSEIRRQILNGTGIFSAFHDSKYYRCNICKFKSVTSSTLLQHIFTHMFFCDHCSYYTYSHYNLSQHLFEKHNLNLIENVNDPLNPKTYDLLYVTRCQDGTFALCMDSSTTSNNDQNLVISSASINNNQSPKKKVLKQNEKDNDIVILPSNQRSITRSKVNEKPHENYILMKYRKFDSMKKSPCLHSLTLEYNICRENQIRRMCRTEDIIKRRRFLTKYSKTRLIDEIANCLRTIVNQIVDTEENSDHSSLVCTLSNDILSPIFSLTNLNTLTNLLKLNNKFEAYNEQNYLYQSEHVIRENRELNFILSSPDTNHSDQLIISSLHSSMTNGDSIFTQVKLDKLPQTMDNTHRYLKTNSKVQKKPPPKPIPLRPVIPKPSLTTASSKSKISSPNIIVLD